jgi:hypothetical protein
VVGEITGSNSGASLWMNSELALEENVLSKWREQGALYNESAGSIIHSEIDRKRYEIKITGKHIRKERSTIHPTITTRIFSSNHRTFALNSGQNFRLHTIAIVYQIFQPTWLTSKR